MSAVIDETGATHGHLYVRDLHPKRTPQGQCLWVCECQLCGAETIVRGSSLRSGHTRSCSCLRLETIRLPFNQRNFK